MLFNSWEFLVLLLLTVPLYYLPIAGNARKVWQVGLLLVASAVFYAWEEPCLLILLSASCLLNAVAVERILFWKSRKILDDEFSILNEENSRAVSTRSAASSPIQNSESKIQNSEFHARRWLFWTVALNLGFLAFFKYAGFLADLLPESPTTDSLKLWFAAIPLPVGISFYTFQGISLVVDVWRNDISPQTAERLSGRGKNRLTSIRDTSFYVAFFPQLVAGPIVKAHEFVDQIGGKILRDIDWITVRRGLILGYFLKIFVADNLAEQTAFLSAGGTQLAESSPLNNLPLLYGYSLQIFADFAGYSLIAIGLGALFGYHLPPNFNFPYLSTSITEFWRRWHLSLSSWLRDYLYFPLGGNRKGSGRTYFNLFLVMFLGGLWHGAAWKFALWGSLHGLFLALERMLGARRRDHGDAREKKRAARRGTRDASEESLERHDDSASASQPRVSTLSAPCYISRLASLCSMLKSMLAWLVTFHIVTALWLTFMMPDMASILAFFKSLMNGKTGFSGPPIFSLVFYGSAVVLYHVWGWLNEHKKHFAQRLTRSPLEPLLHGVMVFLVLTNPGAPRGLFIFNFEC